MSTEPHWVTKYREMLELRRQADEAEKAFTDLAWEIAQEQDEMASRESLIFEEKRVRFSCRGTGIYSQEEWYEEFPVELLFDRAATKMRGL